MPLRVSLDHMPLDELQERVRAARLLLSELASAIPAPPLDECIEASEGELRLALQTFGEAIRRGGEALEGLLPGLLDESAPLPCDADRRALFGAVRDDSRAFMERTRRLATWLLLRSHAILVRGPGHVD